MGNPVIEMILDDNSNLNTQALEAQDNEIVNFFEPTFNKHKDIQEYSKPGLSPIIKEENTTKEADDSELEIIIPVRIDKDKVTDVEPIKYIESSPSIIIDDIPQNEVENEVKTEIEKSNDPVSIAGNSDIEPMDSKQKHPVSSTSQLVDENYTEPTVDVIIGKTNESPQFGVLGKMTSNGKVIGLDLNECNTISLFGVQGAGKSYTIGSITEMVLQQFSKINKLPAPMASVIFHYSESMEYAPEFTSMVYPNDEAGQLSKLKMEYGAEANSVRDVILLAPEAQIDLRKSQYPDIEVHSIGFDSSELAVRDWMFLLAAMGNDSTYIKELKQIMKACRNNMSLSNIYKGIQNSTHLSISQRSLANQKLDFAKEYIKDGCKLHQYLKPGRLIIVDLRDEFIDKEEALGLFVVMLNIFSSVLQVEGKAFNKFIVFDEAHKYMNNKDLVGAITTTIREMRHKGVSIMIASQDPMSLPIEIIELSSIVVMHRFSSPAWVKHVQKAITPLQTLTATEMAGLGSGNAYLWANKATDKVITQRPIKISIRPRVTKHGGDTIQAVK